MKNKINAEGSKRFIIAFDNWKVMPRHMCGEMTSKNSFKCCLTSLLASALKGKRTQELTYPNNDLAGSVRPIIKYTIIYNSNSLLLVSSLFEAI